MVRFSIYWNILSTLCVFHCLSMIFYRVSFFFKLGGFLFQQTGSKLKVGKSEILYLLLGKEVRIKITTWQAEKSRNYIGCWCNSGSSSSSWSRFCRDGAVHTCSMTVLSLLWICCEWQYHWVQIIVLMALPSMVIQLVLFMTWQKPDWSAPWHVSPKSWYAPCQCTQPPPDILHGAGCHTLSRLVTPFPSERCMWLTVPTAAVVTFL